MLGDRETLVQADLLSLMEGEALGNSETLMLKDGDTLETLMLTDGDTLVKADSLSLR